MDRIAKIKKLRAEVLDDQERVYTEARSAGREKLLASEQRLVDNLAEEIREYDRKLEELEAEERRLDHAARQNAGHEGTRGVRVGDEPRTYDEHSPNSYVADLLMRQMTGDAGAAERLARYRSEVETERRDLSRTDGAGGEFVPPAWLLDKYAEMARAGRVAADLFTRLPLPGGTDSINVPRITVGATTAVQTADNASVSETDLETATVTAPVRTIAGQQDVAIQLLEQSPAGFDQVVFRELYADYHRVLGAQALAGTGLNGQIEGVLAVSGTNTVTYTDGSPTIAELYPKGASAVQSVIVNRHLPPTAHVMHPRRWVWMLAQLDTANRPLVVPLQQGPTNAIAAAGEMVDLTKPVGTWLGLPVFLDSGVPTDLGAGDNEDAIITSCWDDHILWESDPRTRVLPEVGSGTLTVRLQLYGYVAATAARFPAATSVVTGTGLTTPSL